MAGKKEKYNGRQQSFVSKGGYMKRITRLAFYSLAAMIITACGGGGDGGGGGPVGPVVTATDPANGATQVPTSKTPITATFSVPVTIPGFPTFINSSSAGSPFSVKNTTTGVFVRGTVAQGSATNQITFTPDVPNLSPGTNYTATIKGGATGVRDLATPPNFMAADYSWSFTTSAWNGTQQLPNTTLTDKANGVATDSSGNIYVTGSTKGGLDGIPNANISASQGFEATATYDVFLVKYDPNGVKQWTRLLGSAFNDEAFGIAIDLSNNIYVAGYTNGSLTGPGNTPNPDTTGATSNAFVAKYDAAGALILVRQSSTAFNNVAYGVAVDAAGTNVYVTGVTGDTGLPDTSGDIFLTQYSSAGVPNWTKTLASTVAAKDRAFGVAVSGGNIYVAGFTSGVLPGTPAGTANQGGLDLFVAQFDAVAANLTPVWVRQFGTAGTDVANAVVADASGVYAAGASNGDAFLIKYDTVGNTLWSNLLGTAGTGVDEAFGITLDASGNVYITGDTEGVLPGSGAVNLPVGAFIPDIFIAKYSAAGAVSWVRQQGSPQTDAGLAVAYFNNSLFVAGYTYGLMPGVNPNFSPADPSGNTRDFFLTRYDTSGVLFN
jgi:hypothetical protein